MCKMINWWFIWDHNVLLSSQTGNDTWPCKGRKLVFHFLAAPSGGEEICNVRTYLSDNRPWSPRLEPDCNIWKMFICCHEIFSKSLELPEDRAYCATSRSGFLVQYLWLCMYNTFNLRSIKYLNHIHKYQHVCLCPSVCTLVHVMNDKWTLV